MIFGPPTLLLTLQSTPLGVTLHDVIEVTIFYPAVQCGGGMICLCVATEESARLILLRVVNM